MTPTLGRTHVWWVEDVDLGQNGFFGTLEVLVDGFDCGLEPGLCVKLLGSEGVAASGGVEHSLQSGARIIQQ